MRSKALKQLGDYNRQYVRSVEAGRPVCSWEFSKTTEGSTSHLIKKVVAEVGGRGCGQLLNSEGTDSLDTGAGFPEKGVTF